MRHSIGTKLLVLKRKIMSPPTGTHMEVASSKLASTARVSKRKSSKKSIHSIGKPSPSKSKATSIPQEQLSVSTGVDEGPTSTSIPAVPVLRSPPPEHQDVTDDTGDDLVKMVLSEMSTGGHPS